MVVITHGTVKSKMTGTTAQQQGLDTLIGEFIGAASSWLCCVGYMSLTYSNAIRSLLFRDDMNVWFASLTVLLAVFYMLLLPRLFQIPRGELWLLHHWLIGGKLVLIEGEDIIERAISYEAKTHPQFTQWDNGLVVFSDNNALNGFLLTVDEKDETVVVTTPVITVIAFLPSLLWTKLTAREYDEWGFPEPIFPTLTAQWTLKTWVTREDWGWWWKKKPFPSD
jgi:hypothetical protein